ncbi:hypothetical protein SLA2020_425330 [Shorea laevis]
METKPAATLGSKWATKQTIPWTNTNQRLDETGDPSKDSLNHETSDSSEAGLRVARHVSEKVDSAAIAQVVLAWVMVASWVEPVLEDSVSKLARVTLPAITSSYMRALGEAGGSGWCSSIPRESDERERGTRKMWRLFCQC